MFLKLASLHLGKQQWLLPSQNPGLLLEKPRVSASLSLSASCLPGCSNCLSLCCNPESAGVGSPEFSLLLGTAPIPLPAQLPQAVLMRVGQAHPRISQTLACSQHSTAGRAQCLGRAASSTAPAILGLRASGSGAWGLERAVPVQACHSCGTPQAFPSHFTFQPGLSQGARRKFPLQEERKHRLAFPKVSSRWVTQEDLEFSGSRSRF